MCVSVVGVKIWNIIDNNIADIEPLQNFFLKMYKSYILRCYNSQVNLRSETVSTVHEHS